MRTHFIDLISQAFIPPFNPRPLIKIPVFYQLLRFQIELLDIWRWFFWDYSAKNNSRNFCRELKEFLPQTQAFGTFSSKLLKKLVRKIELLHKIALLPKQVMGQTVKKPVLFMFRIIGSCHVLRLFDCHTISDSNRSDSQIGEAHDKDHHSDNHLIEFLPNRSESASFTQTYEWCKIGKHVVSKLKLLPFHKFR